MNKFTSFAVALTLLGAAGISSTASADLLPLPPVPVPGLCSTLIGLLPVGVPTDQLTPAQIIEILGKLPAGTTIQQVLACLK